MPDENVTSGVGDEQDGRAATEYPPIQELREQSTSRLTAYHLPARSGNDTAQLQRDIRSGERWLIGLGIFTLAINSIIALIYYGQLKEMRKSTDASTRAANIAADALKSSNESFGKTLGQMNAQTTATDNLAKQARKSADTSQSALIVARRNITLAEKALHIQERAYLGVKLGNASGFDDGNFRASADLVNAGRTPAVEVKVVAFIALTDQILADNPNDPGVLPAAGSVFVLLSGETVKGGEVHIEASKELPDINSGKLFVYTFGRFGYKDVFNCPHEGRFCWKYFPQGKTFISCPNNNFEKPEACQ